VSLTKQKHTDTRIMNYDNLKPKFIIDKDGDFALGKVIFHKDLDISKTGVMGGGWFEIDAKNKVIYLFDGSFDFGPVTAEQITKALTTNLVQWRHWRRFKGFKVMFSTLPKDAGMDLIKSNSEHLLTLPII